jgi:DNA-binding NarL/FixJ family response regulator
LRVAIVNDFPLVTAGVAALLEPFGDRVRVETYDGELPPRDRVDVVLFDPFGRPDAMHRLREICRETSATVLVYAWATTQEHINDALQAGAAGLLAKTMDGEALVAALERIVSDRAEPAGPSSASGRAPVAAWPGQSAGLTPRETEVVALIVSGMSNRDIASALYLSINSVKTYIRTAYRKMGTTNRAQAVVWGVGHGFGPRPPQARSRVGAR